MRMTIDREIGAYVISIDEDRDHALVLPVAAVEHMTKTKLMRAIMHWFNNTMNAPVPIPTAPKTPATKKKATKKKATKKKATTKGK